MLCPAYTRHLWSHREGSNLQPTDYKTVALPVELRWHIPPPLLSPRRNAAVNTAAGVVRFPLRLSRPSLGGDIMISHSQGSFQRDSAGSYRPTQASGFHGWERPNIGGFRLYTLRRAQPLSMCRHTGAGHSCHRFRLHDRRASCPFSGAVRRSRLPGIVSIHSHRNLQDSNLRPLPLSVRRRIPPRPRFRMPPSIPGCQLRVLWSKFL